MSQIAISKVHGNNDVAPSLLAEMKASIDRIRERAFALFERRSTGSGTSADDWLQAERDLMMTTESDLVEKDAKFHLSVCVPGFAEHDLKVTALPDALMVRGEMQHQHEKDKGNVHFCEFGEKKIFRRYDLPEAINVDTVTAQLDKGILRVTAAKAQKERVAARAAS